jgi:uncharacterized protein YcfJ
MKQLFAASLAALAVSTAMAQSYNTTAQPSYSDTAQVLSAQPIYERSSVPRQECANETVTTDRVVPSQGSGYVAAGYQQPAQPAPAPERTIGAGTVIGAIVGGVLGHQFGRSSGGRDVGTGVGVVAGGLIGNQIENSAPSGQPAYAAGPAPARVDYVPETRTVQRCKTVYDGRDEVTGYNVVYRYQGRDYTTRMAYDPGATMRVQVNLTPDVNAARR